MTITRIAVIGAGTMGRDIAYVAAASGCYVKVHDAKAQAVSGARARIGELVDQGIARGKLQATERVSLLERVELCATVAAAVEQAEIVIEAIAEDLAAKRTLFTELEAMGPRAALLATNTSSLSIASIAAAVEDRGRVLGLHFFNPVPAMRLVEVVTHEANGRDAIDRALGFVRQLGKEPIVVRDSPGFASSRLGVALGLEAMRMVEEGVATAEDIDKAMELGYNHPLGPLKLSDLVGLDVRLAIAEYLHRALEEPQFEPPHILRDKVQRGHLGKKSGRGFYVWPDPV